MVGSGEGRCVGAPVWRQGELRAGVPSFAGGWRVERGVVGWMRGVG